MTEITQEFGTGEPTLVRKHYFWTLKEALSALKAADRLSLGYTLTVREEVLSEDEGVVEWVLTILSDRPLVEDED
jgi:hypothetical protein